MSIMKAKFSQCLLSVFICSVFYTSSAGMSCKDFVDDVLTKIKDTEYFQEPYEVPENQKSFGLYELEFGYIYGLSTLHRTDDVTAMKRAGNPYLKVHLAAGEIQINSSVKRKFLNLGRSANVDARIPYVEMDLEIVPKPDGSDPEIKNLKITEVKGLSVKVSGAGLIRDFLLNAFIKTFGRFFKNAIKVAVESKLKDFLKDKVTEYAIPPECLNTAWE